MPSPFPGMDPYLEEPSGWPSVHHRLIAVMSDMLADQLAPHFYVSIKERVYITDIDEPESRQQIAPDIYVVERPFSGMSEGPSTGVITPPTMIEPLPLFEVHDRYLEIHDRKSREVLTTIEILSPRNKAVRSKGREQFINKRHSMFLTQTHWIEIDLLRAGERPQEVEAAGKSDYYTLLRRADAGSRLAVWYTDIRDRLPTIAIPLRVPYEDATLDLQAVLNSIYDRAHYADEIDYAQSIPSPPLRPADAAWAAERVRQWLAARQQAAE